MSKNTNSFIPPPHPRIFDLKYLPLDQLPNAFVQLFLDSEDIFDDVIILIDEKWSLLSNFQFFLNKND